MTDKGQTPGAGVRSNQKPSLRRLPMGASVSFEQISQMVMEHQWPAHSAGLRETKYDQADGRQE
jgi:hypothetical protein